MHHFKYLNIFIKTELLDETRVFLIKYIIVVQEETEITSYLMRELGVASRAFQNSNRVREFCDDSLIFAV